MIEYQETFEKQNNELTSSRNKLQDFTNKVSELEETLTSSSKELVKLQEQNVKLQRDLREVSNYFFNDMPVDIVNEIRHWVLHFIICSQLHKKKTRKKG